MKKILLITTIIQLAVLQLIAQTPGEEIEKLKLINQTVVKNYKEGKFDEALFSGQQALDLSIKIFGNEHLETAASFRNLGEIYRAKKEYDKAAENLQKALDIYQNQSAKNFGRIAAVAESLGVTLVLDGKKKQAEEIIKQSVEAAEKAFGEESKEILSSLKTQTDYYLVVKQFDKTDDLYIRRYKITEKIFGKKSEELNKIEEERICLLSKTLDDKDFFEKQKIFNDAVRDSSIVKSGVLNGKALSLPKPSYPSSARGERAGGTFPVKVLIDESGKVASAKSICGGHLALQQASEDAARKAKFKPTELDGKPVSVSGLIIYKYIP